MIQKLSRHGDHVGLTVRDHRFGRLCVPDHADGHGGNAGRASQIGGEGRLKPVPQWHPVWTGAGRAVSDPSRRAIDHVDARARQCAGQMGGVVGCPAIIQPVGAREAENEGEVIRPLRPDRFGDLNGETAAVFQRAAPLV